MVFQLFSCNFWACDILHIKLTTMKILDASILCGGIGFVLIAIKMIGKVFNIFNKKVKDKNVNNLEKY